MKSFRGSLSNIRGGNPLVNFILGPEPKDEIGEKYIVPLIKVSIPWIVFFGLSCLICIGLVCYWCCLNCCSWRLLECCKGQFTTKGEKGYMIASLFFMVAVTAVGIAGIVISAKLAGKGNETICATALFLDKLVEGSKSDHWVGAKPAAEKLLVVLDNIDSVALNIGIIPVAPATTATYGATNIAILAMFNANKDKTIPRGDQTGNPAPYTPTYIQNLASTDLTTGGTGALQAELDTKKNALDSSFAKVNPAILLLKTGSFLLTLKGDLANAREKAFNVTKSVSDLQDAVLEGGSSGKTGMEAIGGGIIGVFSAELFIAIVAMASIILVLRGVIFFNKLTHISWCILGLLVLLSWILSFIIYPLAVGIIEGCEVFERVLVDPQFFNKTIDKFSYNASVPEDDPDKNSTRDSLYRCFYGDGDILASTRNVLFVFTDIAYALDNTESLTDPTVNSEQIARQRPLVNNYIAGLTTDAPEATTDLTKLNSYTIDNSCTSMKDTWKFGSGSCTTNDGNVFPSGNGADFNAPNPTCIGFDTWPSTVSSIKTRYTSNRFSECGTVNGKTTDIFLQGFVNDFKTSRTAVTDRFTTVKNGLDDVETKNNLFMTQVKVHTNQYKPLRTAYDPLYQPLSNKEEGILTNSNCNFLKQSLINVEEKLCARFAPNVFQIAIVMIIMSFMALFGVIMLFCLAKRSGERSDSKGKYKSAVKSESSQTPELTDNDEKNLV